MMPRGAEYAVLLFSVFKEHCLSVVPSEVPLQALLVATSAAIPL